MPAPAGAFRRGMCVETRPPRGHALSLGTPWARNPPARRRRLRAKRRLLPTVGRLRSARSCLACGRGAGFHSAPRLTPPIQQVLALEVGIMRVRTTAVVRSLKKRPYGLRRTTVFSGHSPKSSSPKHPPRLKQMYTRGHLCSIGLLGMN